jgi:hypothetical protein
MEVCRRLMTTPGVGPVDMAGLAAGTTRSRMTIASVRHQKSLQRSASGVQLFRSLIRYSITSSAFGNVN